MKDEPTSKQHAGRFAVDNSFLGYLLSFLLPLVILGFNYALLGVYPFGSKTELISDLSGQYIDFYTALHSILTQGQSLLYSWQAGMGLNFIGLFAYYLSSPFSLLVVLFPKHHLPEAISLITLLKVGCAGLTFALFARSLRSMKNSRGSRGAFRRESSLWLILLSTCYALNGYVTVYAFNLMWLDGVILLPLVLLGVERLLRTGRWLFLYITLCVLFIANFYIAYMVGLFAFLYFLVRALSVPKKPIPGLDACQSPPQLSDTQDSVCQPTYLQNRGFWPCLGRFIIAAVLAAGSCAWLLLPTFFSLSNNSPSLFALSSLSSFKVNFYPWKLPAKLLPGTFDTLSNAALPNIYSGLLPLLLFMLWFCARKTAKNFKEFILYILLLLFLIASLLLSNLNLIWHAFDAPNSFPYRYSFLIALVVILLAWKALEGIEHLPPLKIGLSWIIGLAVLLCGLTGASYPHRTISIGYGWLSLLLFSAYAALLYLLSKNPEHPRRFILILAILVIGELTLHTGSILHQLDEHYVYVTQERYQERLGPIEKLLQAIPTSTDSQNKSSLSPSNKPGESKLSAPAGTNKSAASNAFYRVERTLGRSYNDPLNLDYPGITHFSSMANYELHETLRKLGFSVSPNGMWVNYAGATPLTDSLLGLAYIISPADKNSFHHAFYTQLLTEQGYTLYHNPWALPIAFLTDRSLLRLDLNRSDPFAIQNDILNLALGRQGSDALPFFAPVPISAYQTHNLRLTSEGQGLKMQIIDSKQEAYIEYTLFPTDPSRPLFAYLDGELSSAKVYVNGHYLGPYLDLYNRKILDLGSKNQLDQAGKTSHEHEIKLKLTLEQDLILYHEYFYEFNPSLLIEAFEALRRQSPQDLEVGSSSIQAEISANKDALLFTSIPYDPGWQAWLNGQKVPPAKVANAFIALEIPAGTHHLSLKFLPVGFKPGVAISGISIISALTLSIFSRLKKGTTIADN